MLENREVFEFQWDTGNVSKNKKHKVEDQESEEPFAGEERFIFKDELHSQNEERFRLFGKTKRGRCLFVVFTKRLEKIRIISSRDMKKKEIQFYEKAIKNSKI